MIVFHLLNLFSEKCSMHSTERYGKLVKDCVIFDFVATFPTFLSLRPANLLCNLKRAFSMKKGHKSEEAKFRIVHKYALSFQNCSVLGCFIVFELLRRK